MTNPWCKFCGTQVDFTDIDYEVSVILGQESVLHTHGIEDNVTTILICNHCSREVRQEMGMKQIFDWSEE